MSGIPLMLAEEDVEMGGIKGIESDFAYKNNVHQANIKIRLAFLRKVYSLLFLQLSVTTCFGLCIMFWPQGRLYVHNNDWLLSVSFVASVVTLIALHIKRRETPINLILLAIFTLVQAYSVGVLVTFFDQFVVLQALMVTVSILAGLTIYTFQTKRDFSAAGVVLYALLSALLLGGLLQIVFGSTSFELVLSVIGALTFSMFIVYDTQDLMKRVSPEEYILATINLYLDIINLFIYILRALQAMRRN